MIIIVSFCQMVHMRCTTNCFLRKRPLSEIKHTRAPSTVAPSSVRCSTLNFLLKLERQLVQTCLVVCCVLEMYAQPRFVLSVTALDNLYTSRSHRRRISIDVSYGIWDTAVCRYTYDRFHRNSELTFWKIRSWRTVHLKEFKLKVSISIYMQ